MSSNSTKTVGKVFYLVAAVLSAVSLVLYVMNANQSYYVDLSMGIAAPIAGALVCEAVVAVLAGRPKPAALKIVCDLLCVAASALLFYVLASFAAVRVQSLANVFGSNLELGNVAAQEAASQAIIVLVLLAVSWLVSVVAAFTKTEKAAL